MFEQLFAKYDHLLIFDTETTGLSHARDEIIEFSAVLLGPEGILREYDELIALSPGNSIPPKITQLTGISNQDVRERGISKEQFFTDLQELLAGKTLLLAYNAHFDLCFLFYFLLRYGDPNLLKGKDKLDLLTVYRDRRAFPHKLCAAIDAYGLGNRVKNSHRAIDDVLATYAVMEEMEKEKPDLHRYVNLFGYNARYGLGSKPISTVRYKPQGYEPREPIYQEEAL